MVYGLLVATSTVAVSTEFKPLLLLDPSTLVFLGKLPVSSEKSWSRKVPKDSPAGCDGSTETILLADDLKEAPCDAPRRMRDASPVIRG